MTKTVKNWFEALTVLSVRAYLLAVHINALKIRYRCLFLCSLVTRSSPNDILDWESSRRERVCECLRMEVLDEEIDAHMTSCLLEALPIRWR